MPRKHANVFGDVMGKWGKTFAITIMNKTERQELLCASNLVAMLSRIGNALLADYSKRLHEVLRFYTGSHPRRTNDDQLIEPIVNKVVPRHGCGTSFTVFGVYLASSCTSNKNWALTVASTIGNKNIDEQSQ